MRSSSLSLLLLALGAGAALQRPPPRRVAARPALSDAATSRRAVLALLPLSLLAEPRAALAAATGGGFADSQFQTRGTGPPKFDVPKLTKGEPGEEELQRLVQGYKRLQYLLTNWEAETTVCIRGCKGKYENCGCTRDPVVVQAYMGFKSMNDPLFKAGDLMLRASSLVKTDEEFERYNAAMEKWNNKADAGNILAYVSSWGEANPGGGQDEIARYLEKSRKEVVESANLLKTIIDCLGVKVDA